MSKCEACGAEVPPGQEQGDVGSYVLCADIPDCVDRMRRDEETAMAAGSEEEPADGQC